MLQATAREESETHSKDLNVQLSVPSNLDEGLLGDAKHDSAVQVSLCTLCGKAHHYFSVTAGRFTCSVSLHALKRCLTQQLISFQLLG